MEQHIMSDGSQHYTDNCPVDCSVKSRLQEIIDGIDSGRIIITRVP